MKLSALLPAVGFTDFTIENEREFTYLCSIVQKGGHPCCTFVYTPKHIDNVSDNVTMVLTTPELRERMSGRHFGICVLDKPRIAFFKLHNYLSEQEGYKRTAFKTEVGKGCRISPMSSIAENNVRIGDNVIIEEFAVVRENTTIGDRCIIRAGAVIGGQAGTYQRDGDEIWAVEQSGGVVLGRDVEIQQQSCITRAVYPWNDTIIGDYSKIFSHVVIGHDVVVGKGVMIVGSTLVAGRTHIMDETWIGPGVTVGNGLTIGRKARINIGSVVVEDVGEGTAVSGNFAVGHYKFLHEMSRLKK